MPQPIKTARAFVPAPGLPPGAAVRPAGTRVANLPFARPATREGSGLPGKGAAFSLLAGEALFMEGDEAEYLYEVESGTICAFNMMADGRRQITGFHFAGDLLGLDVHGVHVYGAETITEARLRRRSHAEIEAFALRNPAVAQRMFCLAIDELTSAQDQMLLLGRKTAQERLVSFLLLLSERARRRGEPGSPLALPMTRTHMADYLGLTIETVSRTFTQLRNAGLVALPGCHRAELLELDALHDLAEGRAGPAAVRAA